MLLVLRFFTQFIHCCNLRRCRLILFGRLLGTTMLTSRSSEESARPLARCVLCFGFSAVLGGNLFLQEAYNLKSINSPRLSGLANKTVVSVQPGADGKGIIFSTSHPVGTEVYSDIFPLFFLFCRFENGLIEYLQVLES